MKCIRVHRARRASRSARVTRGIGVVLLLSGGARGAAAQQPTYPMPQYPGYPAQPPYPQYPVPSQPQAPQYPQLPQAGSTSQPQQPAMLAPYRIPLLTLAQPAEGVVLPDDKPVAVFRFAHLEPLDPIDALSFSVSVDGVDRTRLFTLAHGEAWGPLAPPDELLAPGQHDVRARICSARGACGVAKGTITVVASASLPQGIAASADRATVEKKQRRTRIIDAVLQAARVLIRP